MRVPISFPQSYTFFTGFKTARELLRLDDVKAVWWPVRAVATEVPFLSLRLLGTPLETPENSFVTRGVRSH
jgi:hypothetical protein